MVWEVVLHKLTDTVVFGHTHRFVAGSMLAVVVHNQVEAGNTPRADYDHSPVEEDSIAVVVDNHIRYMVD